MQMSKEELVAILMAQMEKIAKMAAEIAELKARLNQNSKNSSKPPSSDGPNKPPVSLRKPSGKKAGGQPGHEGNGLGLVQKIDESIQYAPDQCAGCEHAGECASRLTPGPSRYEVDIVIQTKTTQHQVLKVDCPLTGGVIQGTFPETITSTVQYGVNIEAMAVSLVTVGMVSIERTHEMMSDVFGISISTGTIAGMVSHCAKKVQPTVAGIKEALKDQPLLGLDETGISINGETYWAHVAATNDMTYISVSAKRGKEGMDAGGILPAYTGRVMHDCPGPYFKYEDVLHALCNAHVLRELIAVIQNTEQAWAQDMIDMLICMKLDKEELILHNQWEAPQAKIEEYTKAYDEILEEARQLNPIPPPPVGSKTGRPKKGKVRALIDRMAKHKGSYMMFYTDFSVPFDNNEAERSFRLLKVKTKVSGCFRTLQGAIDFANIFSFLSTARKRGHSAFLSIKNALLGDPSSVHPSLFE